MINPLNNVHPQIDTSSKTSATPTHQTASESKSRSHGGSTASEQVNVSGRGHIAGTLNQAAHNSNGVDPSRVQSIRDQVASGSTTVSARDIASAMIKAHSNG